MTVCAIGCNLPFNGGNDPSGPRASWLGHEGHVILRGNANTSATACTTIHANQGCYVAPMTESTGFQSYGDSFLDGSGNPKAGWSGTVEILNESYGTWASSLASSGGGAYWDAIRSDIIALKGRHGDKIKFLVVAQPPGTPNGGSTPKVSTWLADLVARMDSHGDSHSLVFAVCWHGYQQGQSGFAKNSSGAYVYPSHPWSLKAFDDFFKAHGLSWLIFNTECGAGMHGTSGDNSFSLSSQTTWYTNACDCALHPNNYVPGLTPGIYAAMMPYCLLDGASSDRTHDTGAFGIIEQSNFSQGPPNSNSYHPAATVLKNAAKSSRDGGATGNFTGAGPITPPPPPPPPEGQVAAHVNPADTSQFIIDQIPATAQRIHLAFAADVAEQASPYFPGLGGSPSDPVAPFGSSITITPPAGKLWMQCLAWDNTDAGLANDIGTWTGWIQATAVLPPPLPDAITEDPINITSDGATLVGTPDYRGQFPAQVWFNYRKRGDLTSVQVPSPAQSVSGIASGVWDVSTKNVGGVASGLSFTVPGTGFTDGMELLAIADFKGVSGSYPDITPGAGYVPVLDENGVAIDLPYTNAASGAHRLRLYRKTAHSEGTTTWASTLLGPHRVTILGIVGGTSPMTVRAAKAQVNAAGVVFPIPQVPGLAGDLEITGVAFCNDDTATFETGLSERADNNSNQVGGGTGFDGTFGITLAAASSVISSSGLTKAYSVTMAGANGSDTAATFALTLAPVLTSAAKIQQVVHGLPPALYDYEFHVSTPAGPDSGFTKSFTVLGQPVPTTLPVTNITQTGATLNGHGAPNGNIVEGYFQIGRTTDYEIGRVPATNVSLGTVEQDVSRSTSPAFTLSPDTVYHVRFVLAWIGNQPLFGDDVTFRTVAVPIPPPPVGPPTPHPPPAPPVPPNRQVQTVAAVSDRVPHFAYPFTRGTNGKIVVVEQDTVEHVSACENVIVRCPLGFRNERPEFGWPFPEFANAPVDTQALVRALQEFEPRGRASAVEYADEVSQAIRHISVDVEV